MLRGSEAAASRALAAPCGASAGNVRVRQGRNSVAPQRSLSWHLPFASTPNPWLLRLGRP